MLPFFVVILFYHFDHNNLICKLFSIVLDKKNSVDYFLSLVSEVLPKTQAQSKKERPRFNADVSTFTFPVLLKTWKVSDTGNFKAKRYYLYVFNSISF